mgnify:CR=1 FL=1
MDTGENLEASALVTGSSSARGGVFNSLEFERDRVLVGACRVTLLPFAHLGVDAEHVLSRSDAPHGRDLSGAQALAALETEFARL